MATTVPVTFLAARWFTPTDGRTIRLLCLHDVEVAEKPDTAEAVARLFHTWDRKASTHEVIDADSVVVCVRDKDVAYAAAGANHDGKHYELAGYASQTAGQWLDDYGKRMLPIAARRVAEDCIRYHIPVHRLTVAELRDKRTQGITHHADVERAFPSTGHSDVGPNFPWDYFLALVAHDVAMLTNPGYQEDDDMAKATACPWGKRLSNGRVPNFVMNLAPDLGPNVARVLAMDGATGLKEVDGDAFGIPYMVVNATSKPIDIGPFGDAVVVFCANQETYDVAAKAG